MVAIDIPAGRIAGRIPLPAPVFPNDVAIDAAARLYVSDSGRNALYRITGSEVEIWLNGDERGNFLVSHYGGRLYRVSPAGNITPLLDLRAAGTRLANFAYLPGRRLLIAPTLENNRLLAFSLAP